MSPVSASCLATRSNACSTVRPSGMVSEYRIDLPLFRSSMMSRMEAAGLDLVFAGLQLAVIAVGADAEPEDAGVADQAVALELVGDLLDAGVRLDHHGRWRWPTAPARRTAACRSRPARRRPRRRRPARVTRKFRKTTIWLRDWRERRGGGVPASGRSASFAGLRHDRPRRCCALAKFAGVRRSGVHVVVARPVALKPQPTLVARICAKQSQCAIRQRTAPNRRRDATAAPLRRARQPL